ncbi:hypothetical protein KY290_009837 [Solanum tuberosum]|uniref:Uncharacterized protein n=1 Tax=Solanum tuberosum TaxID=4113 RepID=A0ABQ7VWP3_SOLTU|nr:hypothetical protein KY289_010218 [Solanum tuberosum]KAH0772700.1 hypothetical protein KY290_009837 [Solanum tuberosum]
MKIKTTITMMMMIMMMKNKKEELYQSALLGVSYGIVSSSWDPMREGSTLGWNEAKKNWPVFWQSISGGGSRKKY